MCRCAPSTFQADETVLNASRNGLPQRRASVIQFVGREPLGLAVAVTPSNGFDTLYQKRRPGLLRSQRPSPLIEDEVGRRYWVFRTDNRWFMQGIFA